MHIDGWAYEPNERELSKQNYERYQELKLIKDQIKVESISNGYAQTTYKGVCPPDMSPKDLAIYLDSGNLCFGGRCSIDSEGKFNCVIYTD